MRELSEMSRVVWRIEAGAKESDRGRENTVAGTMHLQDAAAQLTREGVVLPVALSCLQHSRQKDRNDALGKEHNGGSWRASERRSRELRPRGVGVRFEIGI